MVVDDVYGKQYHVTMNIANNLAGSYQCQAALIISDFVGPTTRYISMADCVTAETYEW